ncbi:MULTISPECIES: hypothetical protein [unclassified Xanthomonas]|uniref:hypothetical protein n=1 Tax=Xanthomonas sp. LMG 8992 TaxID=1591157 RepID=UPI0017C56B52
MSAWIRNIGWLGDSGRRSEGLDASPLLLLPVVPGLDAALGARVVTDHALATLLAMSATAACVLLSSSPPHELNSTLINAHDNAHLLNPLCIFIEGSIGGGNDVA